ncbi:hypothetical protein Dda_3726 [Drechslerella dactyloides]|uniref:Uncharacterized protein n=1 Tax=Drechslerella dactyloides TaxID=74499 RepID=A0AAD6J2T3_DREDA|nr:hypothetical protein Dda_3726 [Drechslerella dactyloides]
MRASRFLPAAAAARRGCRRGTPLHVSDHLWIPESLVCDVFRTFCLRRLHTRSLRRPSAKARKCYTFQPLRPSRAESTSPDGHPDDDAPPSATQNLFSWSFSKNYEGIAKISRLSRRKPATTTELDLDLDYGKASLFDTAGPLRNQLNHLIRFGTSMSQNEDDVQQEPVLDSHVQQDIQDAMLNLFPEVPRKQLNCQPSLATDTIPLPSTVVETQHVASASASEQSDSPEKILDLPPQNPPQDPALQGPPAQELSFPPTPAIPQLAILPQEDPHQTSEPGDEECKADQKRSAAEEMPQMPHDAFEFKVPVNPPVDIETLLLSSEHIEAVEILKAIDLDNIESPGWADKIVLKPHERIQTSPLPSQQDFEAQLLEVISDNKATVASLVMIYSQFDSLVGISNFSDLPRLKKTMYARLGGQAHEWLVWLFRHKSTEILRDPDLMPPSLRKKMVKFEESLAQITPKTANPKSITREDALLDSIWHKLKTSPVFSQWYPLDHPGFVLRFTQADMILDKAIARLKQGDWNKNKKRDVETCLDIFFFYSGMKAPLVLLFPRILELFQAWVPHWKSQNYATRLVKSDPSALQEYPQPGSTDESQSQPPSEAGIPFKPEMIRRIAIQKVRHHLLSTGSERLEGKFHTIIPGLQRLLDCLPAAHVRRLISTLLLSRASPTSKVPLAAGVSWTDAWTLEEIRPFKPWIRRSLDINVTFDDGDHLRFLRDATDLYEAILVTKGHEAASAYSYNLDNMRLVEFHLRTWVHHHGLRYFNDKTFLDELQATMENIIERVRASMVLEPKFPGQPFAQAILSMFYLNLPTELFAIDLIRSLAVSYRTSQLLSCLAILQRFVGKSNGEVVFKIPKHAVKMALASLRRAEPYEALRLLSRYHNHHNATWAEVLVHTAHEYPKETHFVLRRFLQPLHHKSAFNPQIEFTTPRGRPNRNLFSQLAMRYALSQNHSATMATQRISYLRRVMINLGYGADIRVTRALVVAAMVRSGVHRVQTGTEFTAPSDLWKHGRLMYAARRFLQDSDIDGSWRKGLTKAQAQEKKKEFLEQCMIEVWKEVKRWQDRRLAQSEDSGDVHAVAL